MAAKFNQLTLIPKNWLSQFGIKPHAKAFGGEMLKGKRKVARPLDSKKPIHIVLKSTRAKSELSFLNHRKALDQSLQRTSKKWGVRVLDRVWMGNHLHAVIRFANRSQYRSWIRELTAGLVRQISSRTKQHLSSFYDLRPWTRVVEWGNDLRNLFDYIDLNEMELVGLHVYSKASSKKVIRNNCALTQAEISSINIGDNLQYGVESGF